jgi:hypothetical protein
MGRSGLARKVAIEDNVEAQGGSGSDPQAAAVVAGARAAARADGRRGFRVRRAPLRQRRASC